jgi:hypothetical protein
MRTDEDGECVGPIGGVHESVLDTGPAGGDRDRNDRVSANRSRQTARSGARR